MNTMKYLLTVTFSAPEPGGMAGFEAAVATAFPDRRHIHTVSNPRYATGDVPYLGQALEQLQGMDILVQPCLISSGGEWERLKQLVGPDIPLGLPLLNDKADCLACAEAILPTLPDTAVVFMAHGSKQADAWDFSLEMEQAFAGLGRSDVYFANLEGENGLARLLPRLNHRELQLRPFLFCPRLHRQRDLEQLWIPALEGSGHTVDCRIPGLCAYPGLQQLYIGHAQQAASTWKSRITML